MNHPASRAGQLGNRDETIVARPVRVPGGTWLRFAIRRLLIAATIAANLERDLAVLDLAKYKEGVLALDRVTLLGEIEISMEESNRAESKRAFTERLLRRGRQTE
jgi:hypothetical protein